MIKNTQVILKSTPEGEPSVSNFAFTESAIPTLNDNKYYVKRFIYRLILTCAVKLQGVIYRVP